ncbi:hypothetical protein JDV09_21775 [Mycobacterium sp. Y57]|uniref:hypothetical protein n=1 Tax=Mycolicibacterium xanthum TaxID=2796469 RepID=UPI001C846C19|nr:hypothetical protein [Mycolicibacterium xanthum]MBX7434704.1 hypothetical protein [Mycolicibacterium xanthum]
MFTATRFTTAALAVLALCGSVIGGAAATAQPGTVSAPVYPAHDPNPDPQGCWGADNVWYPDCPGPDEWDHGGMMGPGEWGPGMMGPGQWAPGPWGPGMMDHGPWGY